MSFPMMVLVSTVQAWFACAASIYRVAEQLACACMIAFSECMYSLVHFKQ